MSHVEGWINGDDKIIIKTAEPKQYFEFSLLNPEDIAKLNLIFIVRNISPLANEPLIHKLNRLAPEIFS